MDRKHPCRSDADFRGSYVCRLPNRLMSRSPSSPHSMLKLCLLKADTTTGEKLKRPPYDSGSSGPQCVNMEPRPGRTVTPVRPLTTCMIRMSFRYDQPDAPPACASRFPQFQYTERYRCHRATCRTKFGGLPRRRMSSGKRGRDVASGLGRAIC